MKQLYFELLPIFCIPTTALGMANGLIYGFEKKEPFESFSETVGYISIGMITGITYPISFPILAAYVLLRKRA
jgi:hypothetical protein